MGMPVDTPRTWRFGVFELDASSGELRRNGTVVKLREQPAPFGSCCRSALL